MHAPAALTRRQFIVHVSGAAPVVYTERVAARVARPGPGRFSARPSTLVTGDLLAPGEHALGLEKHRDGLLYVPRRTPSTRAPLIVLLHGATGSARAITTRTAAYALADELGIVILAPDSRAVTWDMVDGFFGPDVAFIDRALAFAFAHAAVDPARLAIGGFSDGASYGLTLALMNGDLFTHVVAFSPGFTRVTRAVGRPAIYMSHGTRDDVLPINETSRRLARALKKSGYEVRYREFTGPHTVPPDIVREAFAWVAAPRAQP